MGAIFSFSIFTAIVTTVMFAVYSPLARYCRPAVRRALLLAIVLAPAALAPAGRLMPTPAPAAQQTAHPAFATVIAAEVPPTAPTGAVADSIATIYALGAAAVALLSLLSLARLAVMLASGRRHRLGPWRVVILGKSGRLAPLSWLRHIVVNPADLDDCRLIVTHEIQHLRRLHWVDLLIVQASIVLQWYNPAAWLLRAEMRRVHEFQADGGVIAAGADPREYQMLLIKKAAGARFPSLANSLNHSKLKKRITMMNNQKKSRRGLALGAGALTSAAVVALALCSTPAVAAVLDAASQTSTQASAHKVTTKRANSKSSTQTLVFSTNNDGGNHNITTSTVNGNITCITIDGREATGEELKQNGTSVIVLHSDSTGTSVQRINEPANTRYFINDRPLDPSELDSVDVSAISNITVDRTSGETIVKITTKASDGISDISK